MVKKCEIKFTNSHNGVFQSGQTLEGCVELDLAKPKGVRSIKLEINGFAYASWTQAQKNGFGNKTDLSKESVSFYHSKKVTFIACESYLDTRMFLVGSNDDMGHPVEIPAGLNTYTFQCFIPNEVPTSSEGTHGHIRYTVKVTIERPQKSDQTSKLAFTVIKPLDLNNESPYLRVPSQMEVMKIFWRWPRRSGPLRLKAQIPMSGYTPSQIVDISGWLNNRHSVTVEAIHFILAKTITCFAEIPSSRTKKQTLFVTKLGTKRITTKGFTKFKQALTIPDVVPTNITQSKVIHQTYEIIVEAEVSGFHTNPVVTLPITIGTVPLRQQLGTPLEAKPLREQFKTTLVNPGSGSYRHNPGKKVAAASLRQQPKSALGAVSNSESQPAKFPTPSAPPLNLKSQDETDFEELPPPSYEQSVKVGPIGFKIAEESTISRLSTISLTPQYSLNNYGWNINDTA